MSNKQVIEQSKKIERANLEVTISEHLGINFSPLTGEKFHKVCPNCWVKNRSYNCGFDKCPGYKLLSIETIKKKQCK